MGKSVMKSRMIKSRGFSLLEIIIALAIVGIVLVSLATYARKVIDEHVRQVDAEAVAQEVYGVLQFVNADTIEIFGSTNPADTSKRVIRKVTNPLYQLPGMFVYPDAAAETLDANLKGMEGNPVWLAHPHAQISLNATKNTVSPYIARSFSKSVTSPVSNMVEINDGGKTRYSHSLKWSQAVWGQDSVRHYFTDSGCPENNRSGGDSVYFKQQFLSCNENPTLRRSEIAVSRVDLVNDKGSFTRGATSDDLPAPVNRVDVYVSFTPVDGNPARLEQFITPLITAFRAKNIVPNVNNVYLVMQNGSNSWVLLNKNGMTAGYNTDASDLAVFTDLPNMVGKLQKGRYALRFTFDGSGDYLRTDGLNAATKLCWNTAAGAAGPCLTSPSEELLVLKSRKGSNKLSNLQVSSVISTINHEYDAPGGKKKVRVEEYYTAPRIQYKAFSNNGVNIPPVNRRKKADGTFEYCSARPERCGLRVDANEIAETKNGAISVDLQTCPEVDGWMRPGTADHHLYPRLSVAVSSVISGLHKDGGYVDNNIPQGVFNYPDVNPSELGARPNISINRLGGEVLQIRKRVDSWRISSYVASEDISPLPGHENNTWIHYNPSWMSVMITTWCSSIPQPEKPQP